MSYLWNQSYLWKTIMTTMPKKNRTISSVFLTNTKSSGDFPTFKHDKLWSRAYIITIVLSLSETDNFIFLMSGLINIIRKSLRKVPRMIPRVESPP